MRVLITGGFGFIGGRVALRLRDMGHAVVLGTRRAQPPPVWLKSADVAVTAWADDCALASCCAGMDAIVHAAGMNAQDSASDPVMALDVNGVATGRLVRAARATGVQRLLYLSTIHVYGAPLVGVVDEDSCPRNPHPYATSHRAGEDAVRWGFGEGDGRGLVLRLSNAVGSPAHSGTPCWSLLVNDLCRQAAEVGRLTLHSSGRQVRDFVAVGDVCAAIHHLLGVERDALHAQVMNVAAGRAMTVLAMAQLVQTRCEAVLGFLPPLTCQYTADEAGGTSLEVRVARLAATGFRMAGDISDEVDALLRLCQAAFGVSRHARS